jgi:hypothetical protein
MVKSENEFDAAQEAQEIVQTIAKAVQKEAHDKIAGVVTRCLATVFEEPYEFKIKFNRARGRTEADLIFIRNGREVDPMRWSGRRGGLRPTAIIAHAFTSGPTPGNVS